MTELALILTNFPTASVRGDDPRVHRAAAPGAPGDGGTQIGDASGAAGAQWGAQRLPALELLLARAHAESLAHGWRGWVAERFGWPQQDPSAALAAAACSDIERAREPSAAHLPAPPHAPATPSAAAAHYWFASPLHLFAGLDSVHLHPAGLLELTTAEQRRLAADFAHVFAGTPWTLTVIGQRELLLTGPTLNATAAEPEALLTHAPEDCMARGADAAALRRLSSEMELWLHEHSVNVERARRGALPVTALWLWGGANAPARPASATPVPQVHGNDSYIAALCHLRGGSPLPLPDRIDALLAVPSAERTAPPVNAARIVLLTLEPAALAGGLIGALTDLEQRWLAGAVQAVRSRRVRALHCLLGGRAYRLTWHHCIRVWRARAPWWEGL